MAGRCEDPYFDTERISAILSGGANKALTGVDMIESRVGKKGMRSIHHVADNFRSHGRRRERHRWARSCVGSGVLRAMFAFAVLLLPPHFRTERATLTKEDTAKVQRGTIDVFCTKKKFLGTSSLYLAALQGGKKEQEQLPRRERLPQTYGVQQACRQRFSLQTDPRSTPRRRSTERWRNRSTGNHSPHRRFRRNLPRTVLDKTDEFTGGRAYSVSLEDFLKVLSNV